jgi:IS4 transposase
LTDEKGAEKFDRVPVEAGEIRIGDRGYCHVERLATISAAHVDFVVRAGWRMVRWLDEDGETFNLLAALTKAEAAGRIDRKILLWRAKGAPLAVRLVAFCKPPAAIEMSRRKARREAKKEGFTPNDQTLMAAGWVLLVTSLPASQFSTEDISELYRARWRIEMAFKRLKSLVGLAGPPGDDPNVAKTWILAHLLMVVLLEPHTAVVDDSPRSGQATLAA